jgi:hypothetical protein
MSLLKTIRKYRTKPTRPLKPKKPEGLISSRPKSVIFTEDEGHYEWTLEEILSKIPDGIDNKDVKVALYLADSDNNDNNNDSWSYSYGTYKMSEFSVSYFAKIPDENYQVKLDLYENNMVKYKKDYAKWKIDLAKWKEEDKKRKAASKVMHEIGKLDIEEAESLLEALKGKK